MHIAGDGETRVVPVEETQPGLGLLAVTETGPFDFPPGLAVCVIVHFPSCSSSQREEPRFPGGGRVNLADPLPHHSPHQGVPRGSTHICMAPCSALPLADTATSQPQVPAEADPSLTLPGLGFLHLKSEPDTYLVQRVLVGRR